MADEHEGLDGLVGNPQSADEYSSDDGQEIFDWVCGDTDEIRGIPNCLRATNFRVRNIYRTVTGNTLPYYIEVWHRPSWLRRALGVLS